MGSGKLYLWLMACERGDNRAWVAGVDGGKAEEVL